MKKLKTGKDFIINCNENYHKIFSSFFNKNDWFSFAEVEVIIKDVKEPYLTYNGIDHFLFSLNKNNVYGYSSKFFPTNFTQIGKKILPFPLPINLEDEEMPKSVKTVSVIYDIDNKNLDFLKRYFNNKTEFIKISDFEFRNFTNECLYLQCISDELLRFFLTYYLGQKNFLSLSIGKRSDHFDNLRYLNIVSISELNYFIPEVSKHFGYFLQLNKSICVKLNSQSTLLYYEWLNEAF